MIYGNVRIDMNLSFNLIHWLCWYSTSVSNQCLIRRAQGGVLPHIDYIVAANCK
jgi:hypothetical protein